METFAQFIGQLSNVVQRQVKRKEIQEYLVRLMAFKNSNVDCQLIL